MSFPSSYYDPKQFLQRYYALQCSSIGSSTPVLVSCDGFASKRGSRIAGNHQILRGVVEISGEHDTDQRMGEQYLYSDSPKSGSAEWPTDTIRLCQEARDCAPDQRLEFSWSARVVDCQTQKSLRLVQLTRSW